MMASIRNKCTKLNNNYTSDNNLLNYHKSCAKIFDQNSGSHTNNCNNNSLTNGSRPQLRWSQSFSPTDRQKPNVTTLIRRKSAVERLAETKFNYIKSPAPPLPDRTDRDGQKLLHKSLSTSALKPSLVILTQSPPILLTTTGVDCHPNQLNSTNNCQQSLHSSGHPYSPPTTPTTGLSNSAQPVTVQRKRNPSLSSRLSSESSHNLEQQLRQLIADNSEEQTIDGHNKKKVEAKGSVIKSVTDSPLKPKPKERLKSSNQQILRQNSNVVPKERTIFTNCDKTNVKTIVDNKKTSINNSILRFNSSHKSNNNNNINNKITNNIIPKLIIQSKPLAQPLQQKTNPVLPISAGLRSTSTTAPTSRQMSISRSKSDVSNSLLIKRNKSKDEIERFFETLGLDSSVWDTIKSEATNSLISTPAHYFESCDSFESSDLRRAVMSSSSSSSSSTDRHSTSAQPTVERQPVLNTRLMQSRSCHALSSGTSIVEKNARVIKWLYNCRKAMV